MAVDESLSGDAAAVSVALGAGKPPSLAAGTSLGSAADMASRSARVCWPVAAFAPHNAVGRRQATQRAPLFEKSPVKPHCPLAQPSRCGVVNGGFTQPLRRRTVANTENRNVGGSSVLKYPAVGQVAGLNVNVRPNP